VHRISDFSRELKKASSGWVAERHVREFQWQEGYSIFSEGSWDLDGLKKYIDGQEEHHRKQSFEDELKALLEDHGVQYDPRYLL
jgi:hypothetical protein